MAVLLSHSSRYASKRHRCRLDAFLDVRPGCCRAEFNESGIVDLKDIKAIIDLMKKNSISEFELGAAGFQDQAQARRQWRRLNRLSMKIPSMVAYAATGRAHGRTRRTPAPQPALGMPPPKSEIKSPMIGTFYRAPSPEAGHYVEVGTEVNPGHGRLHH